MTYQDERELLNVEVTSAYYDGRHARLLWESARGKPDGPKTWGGVDFDRDLLEDVKQRLAEKSRKDYGTNCILLIYVRPPLTTAEEMQALLESGFVVPDPCPFDAVYLVGDFPPDSTSEGGYRWWKVWP